MKRGNFYFKTPFIKPPQCVQFQDCSYAVITVKPDSHHPTSSEQTQTRADASWKVQKDDKMRRNSPPGFALTSRLGEQKDGVKSGGKNVSQENEAEDRTIRNIRKKGRGGMKDRSTEEKEEVMTADRHEWVEGVMRFYVKGIKWGDLVQMM